jgi:hypothetical protein
LQWVAWANLFARGGLRKNTGKLLLAQATQLCAMPARAEARGSGGHADLADLVFGQLRKGRTRADHVNVTDQPVKRA